MYALLGGLLCVGCVPAPDPDNGARGQPESAAASIPAADEAASVPAVDTSNPGETDLVAQERSREDRLDEADRLAESGRTDEASAILRKLLIAAPDDVDVVFRLANLNASSGDFAGGIELLSTIPEDHPDAGLPALGQSADWCLYSGQFEAAEARYRRILRRVPEAAMAHRQLAVLLNRQGRRHEAAEHVRHLCRLGDIRQDELHSLIVLSDAMVADSDAGDPDSIDYSPIGVSGQARVLFTEKRYAEAADVLRESVIGGNCKPAVSALYGRSLAEAQDEDAFRQWLSMTDDSVREFAEYWSAVAAYLASQQQAEPAIRAALEALDRDPTDFLTINRVLLMFRTLDRRDEYTKWEKRWTALHQILTENNSISASKTPNVEAIDELSAQLFALDRKLEAVLWKSLEAYYRGLPPAAMEHWNGERQKLVAAGAGFPDQASRLCGFNRNDYPLPDIKIAESSFPKSTDLQQATSGHPHPAAFRNVANDVGLTHAYQVASDDRADGFAMYQQAGGGIAVLDYDLDGWPDLYFAQGAADPPVFKTSQSDQLYRSVNGKIVDVTAAAGVTDDRYTIGCTAGDWNQDGFPDLVTTSIGADVLWINRGDGTFSMQMLDGSGDLHRMPASVVIADLNGDSLPDLFELNYIDDPEIAKLPSRDSEGNVIDAVGPGDFASAMDRIGLNDTRGNARFAPISQLPEDAHKGLGVVVANLDGKRGNEVFVGNDKSPNQMWVRDAASGTWSDVAVINGSAYSSGGAGTASMGIAAGDFDNNGFLDLHIANFQNESVCLYLNRDGNFRDRAIQFKLGVPSRSVLGFGSQSVDYDNNGMLDLVVTNGHIDQYKTMSGPFRQLPQLFCNLGDQFQLVEVADPSGYWQAPHLGRGLARLDFNRDGKLDFAISHVGETSALMINETQSDHHWLQLQLVGVQSERDAVGAKLIAHYSGRKTHQWVVGGDGYLARNEPTVSFGLGDAKLIDQLEIQWPSGATQAFANVSVDKRILIIEGEDDLF
ncbi:MAG: VCBS repeat-containing protein [Planctomycetales bacterium]|nr:VCBS repeat-containing protein [Planctomycetales bacterium]